MARKFPQGVSDIKTAADAFFLILKQTDSYQDDTGTAEDRLLYRLREFALAGLKADTARVTAELDAAQAKLAKERNERQALEGRNNAQA